jgi:hypothetical protein
MTKGRSGSHANVRGTVKELFTQATLPALNRALLNRRINPHAIVTIAEMHGPATAGPRHPQFRVLYEVH